MMVPRASPWLLLLLAVVSISTQAALVRANCRGIQELSLSEAEVSCYESNTLTDSAGHIMFGYTAAAASLKQGKLTADATGGAIRDVGYNGGEATALLKDKISIRGEWQGSIPVTVQSTYDADTGSGSNPIHTTSFTYNGLGQMTKAQINDGIDPADVAYSQDLLDMAANGFYPETIWPAQR